MYSLSRASWPASLARVSAYERGTLVTVRHRSAWGEPGLVVIWRLPLVEISLDERGGLVIVTGNDNPITFQSSGPRLLLVRATADRRHLDQLRAECDDGSAITVEFLRE